MNAHDLLELNDRFIAFNLIMKGELKKEMDEAKKALESLRLGRDLCLVRNQLQDREKAVQAQIEASKAIIKEEADLLEAQKVELTKREQELTAREQALKAQRELLENDTNNFINDQEKHERHVKSVHQSHIDHQAKMMEQEQEYHARLKALHEREKEVERKLSVLKTL